MGSNIVMMDYKQCACGCGEVPKTPGSRFVWGHNSKTEETRKKLSLARKGKKRSDETRKKLSLANIGKKHSDETRKKLSLANKGKIRSEESRRKYSLANKGKNSGKVHSDETRKKLSLANIGKKRSDETRKKLSLAHKGENNPNYGKPRSDETRKKISAGNRGVKRSEEFKKKLSLANIGKKPSDETRKKLSKKMKKNWLDPNFVKKMAKAFAIKPNKPEQFIMKLLNKLYPNEWKYTGDFSFIVNGKSPDFTSINGEKKLIEFYGDYWHKKDCPEDKKRIDIIKEWGWSTLIIWEHELTNMTRVIFRIHKFMRSKLWGGK